MKLIADCQDCGEQKILEEWTRCKSCRAKWFLDALNKPDYFADDDVWYVIPPTPEGWSQPASSSGSCNHKSVQENLDCTDGLHDPQPNPGKVSPGPTFSDNFFSERAAKVQRELNNIFRDISRKCPPTKNLPPTKP